MQLPLWRNPAEVDAKWHLVRTSQGQDAPEVFVGNPSVLTLDPVLTLRTFERFSRYPDGELFEPRALDAVPAQCRGRHLIITEKRWI